MSLTDALIKYLDRKFATLEKRHVRALEQQNEILENLFAYLRFGPDWEQVKMGSAEDDKIDDSAGEFQIDSQAEKDIKDQWVEDGYPDDVTQYFR